MSTTTNIAAGTREIVMTRIYHAPREVVWEAMTQATHVAKWWGGPGFSNPVCEMDVRPGGHWRHVMRFPDGRELAMHFVFVDVEKPERLVWRHANERPRKEGSPAAVISVTLDDLGDRTRWTMLPASIRPPNVTRLSRWASPSQSRQ